MLGTTACGVVRSVVGGGLGAEVADRSFELMETTACGVVISVVGGGLGTVSLLIGFCVVSIGSVLDFLSWLARQLGVPPFLVVASVVKGSLGTEAVPDGLIVVEGVLDSTEEIVLGSVVVEAIPAVVNG